jgi:lipopolysaccharide biosynthesis glycosyltransferase
MHLHWLSPGTGAVRELPVRNHVTVVTYFRLLIPELLPLAIKKAIYLDCDVLVEGDLSKLWEEELGDNYILAAQGRGRKRLVATSPLALIPEVTFDPNDQYFNAGVLVLNLERLREGEVAKKAIEFCRKWGDVILHADQDALNAMSIGRWRRLDQVWNQFINEGPNYNFVQHIPGGILHFSSGWKPWLPRRTKYHQRNLVGAAHRIYDKYLYESCWFTPFERQWYLVVRAFFRYVGRPLAPGLRKLANRVAA